MRNNSALPVYFIVFKSSMQVCVDFIAALSCLSMCVHEPHMYVSVQ